MPQPKLYVDGRLITWSDTLFSPPYRPVRGGAPKVTSWKLLPLESAAAKARDQIGRTAKKTPEVMVKITNKKGAGRGMANIRNHIDYISRNGKLEIEDQNGELLLGRNELNNFKENWQISGGRTIPEEAGEHRDTLNVIFSMAAGTPPERVKAAVRDFLQDEFAGREYVFVLHTDTPHPHVHVCIKTGRTPTLKRLSPRRNDLQRWREGFAQQLREHGIEANATPRRTRGVTRLPVKQATIHRAKRQRLPIPAPHVDLKQQPHFAQRERIAWREITHALNNSEHPTDVQLAKQVLNFWRQTPAATATNHTITEGKTHERTRLARLWQFVATRLHQPDSSQAKARIEPQAHPYASMWTLPRRNMAYQPGEATPVLLYTDALDYLGRRSPTNTGMRRGDIRAPGTDEQRITTKPAAPLDPTASPKRKS